jgi:hypothetical protein
MRILGLLKADAESEAGTPPSPELIAKVGAFMEEAVEWTKRFLEVLGGGESELRPIFEESDFAPQ